MTTTNKLKSYRKSLSADLGRLERGEKAQDSNRILYLTAKRDLALNELQTATRSELMRRATAQSVENQHEFTTNRQT